MISAPLAAVAVVFAVATGPETAAPLMPMSAQQKSAAMLPLIRLATKCIANSVADDPRFATTRDIGDLIVDSMPSCASPVRAMIDAYDGYFGSGSGEAFFVGPYLDILPRAVGEWIANPSR
jgi:hypothetical protein